MKIIHWHYLLSMSTVLSSASALSLSSSSSSSSTPATRASLPLSLSLSLMYVAFITMSSSILWLPVCTAATSVQIQTQYQQQKQKQLQPQQQHANGAITTVQQQQQQQRRDKNAQFILQQQQLGVHEVGEQQHTPKKRHKRYKNNDAPQLLQQRQSQRHQQQQQPRTANNAFIPIEHGIYHQETDEFDEDDDDNYESNYSYGSVDSFMQDSMEQQQQHHRYDVYSCCSLQFGACRNACENLSLVQLAAASASESTFRLELKKYCSSMQMEFWSCMNTTLEAVARGSEWPGRHCCALGLAPRCRNACMLVDSLEELLGTAMCRQSDEQHMLDCFGHVTEMKSMSDRCCGNARTSECQQACREMFEPHGVHAPTLSSRQLLQSLCDESNAEVVQCVRNATNSATLSNPQNLLPCCDRGATAQCRDTCRSVMTNTEESTDLIIGELEKNGCGKLKADVPLWQCFLDAERHNTANALGAAPVRYAGFAGGDGGAGGGGEVSQINQIGMDAAKLHCCEKAATLTCRRLCAQTYSSDWTVHGTTFERNCVQSPAELQLRQCLDEVDEPCQLGCDGLSFCTNYNNRPTELFRSCTAEADNAARADLQLWQQQATVSLPGVQLAIKNVTRCAPARWKAIVCALQLKPCTWNGHYSQICHDDCYDILEECMDWQRMNDSLNANAICARLYPVSKDVPCVSLRPFTAPSSAPQETGGHHGLTAPCRAGACNASDVCVAQRNESRAYSCLPGCTLGETSSYVVALGAYVRIPVLSAAVLGAASTSLTAAHSSATSSRFKVCRCGALGRIENCQPLPSFPYDNCMLPGGRSIRHGESFYLECNLCSCYAAEVTCTKKQCRFPDYKETGFTSLPCNCATHHVPVCGLNGNTYHSACIARCLGLTDVEVRYGACEAFSPCQPGAFQCPAGAQCVEQRKVCLSGMHRPCLQYTCVNETRTCDSDGPPVCDTRGQTHASACHLLHAKATLGHWGACCRSCSWSGPVCGINGVTYRSECAAWADYALVDYRGTCRQVGLLVHDMGERCRSVRCARLAAPYCQPIVPPGACCPICGGGALRIIYSRKQIDRAMYALPRQSRDLLTLQSVLHELDALVEFSECQLSGYLTMEVGIFVAVTPRAIGGVAPTRVQIEACTREAQKLSALIEGQSHKITTNLILSGLTVSHLLDPTMESGGSAPAAPLTALLTLSVAVVALLGTRGWRRRCVCVFV